MTGPTGPAATKTAIDLIHGKYLALHCIEAPEVLFVDVMDEIVEAKANEDVEFERMIDPNFIGACEPGSLRIIATHSDGVSAASHFVTIRGGSVVIHVHVFRVPKKFNVRITLVGTRKGFKGVRFPVKTENEAARNNEFWNQSSQR